MKKTKNKKIIIILLKNYLTKKENKLQKDIINQNNIDKEELNFKIKFNL